jgi:hypothetical protein
MILSRLRYRPVIERHPPLPIITDRYGPFPIVTKRYMRYQALHALPSVTERYRTLQSVTYFILKETLNELF